MGLAQEVGVARGKGVGGDLGPPARCDRRLPTTPYSFDESDSVLGVVNEVTAHYEHIIEPDLEDNRRVAVLLEEAREAIAR